MQCEPLQDLWLLVVNTCICTDLFTGFYTLWTSQLLTSLFLFLGVVLGSISWQYFDLPVMGYAVFVPAGTLAKVRVRLGRCAVYESLLFRCLRVAVNAC